MVRHLVIGLIGLLVAGSGIAQTVPALDGRWIVDLSTDPAKSYTKAMELRLAADGSVTGSFYNSVIQAGRWKADRGRTCVSFRTSDGAGPYHSAACLVGMSVRGQTWAEHRSFLFNWNAVRPAR